MLFIKIFGILKVNIQAVSFDEKNYSVIVEKGGSSKVRAVLFEACYGFLPLGIRKSLVSEDFSKHCFLSNQDIRYLEG